MRNSNGLYILLQVLPDADPAVIEAAYKALMKKYHPDRVGGVDAERKAAEISHAFNVLRDPERRAAYDAQEKALDERHRFELARSFEPPKPPPPPPRPEPRPGPGNRVAAWIGAAGVAVLAATIVLLARGTSEAPASKPVEAAVSAEADAGRTIPFRDQPVSRGHVGKAVGEFLRVAGLSGVAGAAAFSERCFEAQAESLDINDFDFCVAFDHAAGRADLPDSDLRTAAARRFQPQNQVARHVRAADPMADSFASIELRLFEIRRMADSALTELTRAEPIDAGGVVTPAAAPARRSTVQAARPRRAAPRAAREPAARQEQDFLEREGGIY